VEGTEKAGDHAGGGVFGDEMAGIMHQVNEALCIVPGARVKWSDSRRTG